MDTESIRANNIRKRCEWLVIAMVGKVNSDKWWNSKNKAFDMRTPEEQYQLDPEKVYNYLMHYSDYTI
jgi:hypothetical protein